ncbi:MAG: tRNA (adenosine(37)-N6)-dimethylallyltransferase MiaA [Flavobacteriaceae bacterium]|nr:tRNA (adenosine(37)-N6)-dimethylallyltransferase MiaA [Flavobacteriaceae bacterium]|tara:strand:- start:26634 stop:27530 length:897 start_codon:yes stop_codon:yes gene_type:complete
MKKKTLIYITGATGIGKTKVSILLANKLNSEIISSDSRQFYKEMTVGTSVPSANDLKTVKHHFIQHMSVVEDYSIGNYEKDCIKIINEKFKIHDLLIMTGGSGMYADSVLYGLDEFPNINKKIRNNLISLFRKKGIGCLQEKLKEKDPIYYRKIDLNNHQRIIRALEVCIFTGKTYSSFLKKRKANRIFNIKILIIEEDRNKLYKKINNRVDLMIKNGLEKEAKSLIKYRDKNSLQTVGYKEFFDFFNGNITKDEAILKIKKNTRNYAKRQITWNKKYKNAIRISPNTSLNKILKLIN